MSSDSGFVIPEGEYQSVPESVSEVVKGIPEELESIPTPVDDEPKQQYRAGGKSPKHRNPLATAQRPCPICHQTGHGVKQCPQHATPSVQSHRSNSPKNFERCECCGKQHSGSCNVLEFLKQCADDPEKLEHAIEQCLSVAQYRAFVNGMRKIVVDADKALSAIPAVAGAHSRAATSAVAPPKQSSTLTEVGDKTLVLGDMFPNDKHMPGQMFEVLDEDGICVGRFLDKHNQYKSGYVLKPTDKYQRKQ